MKKENKPQCSYKDSRSKVVSANKFLPKRISEYGEYNRLCVGCFFLVVKAIRKRLGYSVKFMLEDLNLKTGYGKLLRHMSIVRYEQGEYIFLRLDYAILFYEWLMSDGIRENVLREFAAFSFDELLFSKVRYKDSGLLVIDNLPLSILETIEDRRVRGLIYVDLVRYKELRSKFGSIAADIDN